MFINVFHTYMHHTSTTHLYYCNYLLKLYGSVNHEFVAFLIGECGPFEHIYETSLTFLFSNIRIFY